MYYNYLNNHQIILPTGTVITADEDWGVTIYASLEDYNKVQGLCGTFTGKCEDDFLLRDGTYNPFPALRDCESGSWTDDHFPEFSASWR